MNPDRAAHRRKTREQILETAFTLIQERGIEGVSLREIARRVHYSPAGIYDYFENKDGILVGLVHMCHDQFMERLRGVLNIPSPRERLVQLSMAYIQFAREKPQYFQLLATHTIPDKKAQAIKPPGRGPGTASALVRRTLEEGAAEGVFTVHPGADLNTMTRSICAMTHGLAMIESSGDSAPHPANAQRRLAEHEEALRMLVNGMCTGSTGEQSAPARRR